MSREIKMSHLQDALDELEYPVNRADAAEAFEDATLLLADGTESLDALIENASSDRFASREELVSDLHNTLPRSAVGEPYQSEGDA